MFAQIYAKKKAMYLNAHSLLILILNEHIGLTSHPAAIYKHNVAIHVV